MIDLDLELDVALALAGVYGFCEGCDQCSGVVKLQETRQALATPTGSYTANRAREIAMPSQRITRFIQCAHCDKTVGQYGGRPRQFCSPYCRNVGRHEPPEVRFWRKVDKDGPEPEYAPSLGPCWFWTGALTREGYGSFGVGSSSRKAHALSWSWERGPVPDGLVLDHLCRVRRCVRPSHLEPVTDGENSLRGMAPSIVAFRNDTCLKGLHSITGDNVMLVWGGKRTCRACHNERRRARYAEHGFASCPPRACVLCGGEYRSPNKQRRFCSVSCGVKYQHRLKARAYDACPDPDCRCVDTLRGLDRAGCPIHDPDPAPSTSGAAGAGGAA